MSEEKKGLFAVFAKVDEYDKPLILTHRTFARIIDEVVFPYENDEPFFIDGVPITRKKIRNLKILRQKENFSHLFALLHRKLQHGDRTLQKTYGEQYYIRMEAILRQGCEDVTSQVIKAFDSKIKPSLKDYLSKKPELIQAAYQVFLAAIKVLS